MGKLIGIAIKKEKYGNMIHLDTCNVRVESGLEGDFRGAPGKRQVTVLSREGFEAACQEIHSTLPWTTRRANLLVEGIELAHTTGQFLSIGTVLLEITGETEPCHRMDEQCSGLTQALRPDWRGGVCCRVVRGGTISISDEVMLTNQQTT